MPSRHRGWDQVALEQALGHRGSAEPELGRLRFCVGASRDPQPAGFLPDQRIYTLMLGCSRTRSRSREDTEKDLACGENSSLTVTRRRAPGVGASPIEAAAVQCHWDGAQRFCLRGRATPGKQSSGLKQRRAERGCWDPGALGAVRGPFLLWLQNEGVWETASVRKLGASRFAEKDNKFAGTD